MMGFGLSYLYGLIFITIINTYSLQYDYVDSGVSAINDNHITICIKEEDVILLLSCISVNTYYRYGNILPPCLITRNYSKLTDIRKHWI